MVRLTGRRLRRRTLGAAALVLMIGGSDARAACYDTPARLPRHVITDFLEKPAQLMQRFPKGGSALIAQIRDLVASDPATLQPIIQLLANANPDQRDALGIGLGQAALTCLRVDQASATGIQQAVAGTDNKPFILAFSSVFGDRPIAAVGGGGGGASTGAGGGQVNPITQPAIASGGATTFDSTAVRNIGTNLFTSSVLTPGGGTFPNTTTLVTPVSPSR